MNQKTRPGKKSKASSEEAGGKEEELKETVKKAKENAKRIQFSGRYYRSDIGFDLKDPD